jgi:hypothetical protein
MGIYLQSYTGRNVQGCNDDIHLDMRKLHNNKDSSRDLSHKLLNRSHHCSDFNMYCTLRKAWDRSHISAQMQIGNLKYRYLQDTALQELHPIASACAVVQNLS